MNLIMERVFLETSYKEVHIRIVITIIMGIAQEMCPHLA